MVLLSELHAPKAGVYLPSHTSLAAETYLMNYKPRSRVLLSELQTLKAGSCLVNTESYTLRAGDCLLIHTPQSRGLFGVLLWKMLNTLFILWIVILISGERK